MCNSDRRSGEQVDTALLDPNRPHRILSHPAAPKLQLHPPRRVLRPRHSPLHILSRLIHILRPLLILNYVHIAPRVEEQQHHPLPQCPPAYGRKHTAPFSPGTMSMINRESSAFSFADRDPPVLFQIPQPIDPDTPQSARTRTGFDGQDYELVFSDERGGLSIQSSTPSTTASTASTASIYLGTFYLEQGAYSAPITSPHASYLRMGRSHIHYGRPSGDIGDDPFWEAVDLWYGVTGDVEWYDPSQVVTKDGHLVITIDSTDTAGRGVTKGSTAPFTAADNHGLKYRSGMIQTWNKFCFTSGYVEVSVTFPGPTSSTAGYTGFSGALTHVALRDVIRCWPGAWTMGNLGRPGYQATTDGMWPYTYDECDLGTFPNQTNPDGATPAAAKFSDQSRSRYNNELSWLSGQRASACSCPGSDHPGPAVNVGRGAPEIDIFEASIEKVTKSGGTVSQSAQFAPFAHDYSYQNDSEDKWKNFDPGRTRANTFKGSAVQQSVSGVTTVPDDMFQGSGAKFTSFGFECYGHPQHRDDGYVMWQVDGKPTHRVGAGAVGPDMGAGGAMIGRRLIPEEPMALVLNLGMSPNWQDIVESSMMFPGEMLVDYVRVYQRKNEINVGCDPKGYPTKKYIDEHLEAYQDVNMTLWKWDKPKNSLWSGGC
ncbi:hypothetical protein D9611_010166 [Ephemerocybe angulata]|uniref:GH16 domain-containing protein n=1 Tax=Ephemerocybe angulata TaxID=980116 RepID=A0A8H5AYZ2_9AGAR|nr:hypothetical protein D9611_010166 [Tulosesus angulatus]